MRLSSLLLACLVLVAVPAGAQDFAELYPATVDHVKKDAEPLAWDCDPNDVWELSGFAYDFGKELKLKLGKSTVVFGRHESNVVWAVVLPEKPAKLKSSMGGKGEKVEHVLLRFHPGRVGELFPAKTVRGQGAPEQRLSAFRVVQHKLRSFHAERFRQAEDGEPRKLPFPDYRPTVPPHAELILDMDTDAGTRRVFTVNEDTKEIRLRGNLLTRGLDAPPEIDRRLALQAFERGVEMGRELKDSGVACAVGDWEEHVKECKKGVSRATSVFDVAVLMHGLFSPFDDPTLRMRAGDDLVPPFTDEYRLLNASGDGVEHILGSVTRPNERSSNFTWGRTRYGISYVLVRSVDDQEDLDTFDGVLDEVADDWGVILDLRWGLSGDPELLQRLMGRFVSEPLTYGRHAFYAAGGLRDDGPLEIQPRGPWTYGGVVWALVGPRTSGPAEHLALMVRALPKNQTLGEPTSGVGLYAEWEEIVPGLSVFRRSGMTFDAEDAQVPVDGLMPSRPVVVEPLEFGPDADPVLYKALEEIYLIPHEERRQAKSGEQWPWPEDLNGSDADAAEEGAGEGEEEASGEEEGSADR